MRRIQLQTGLSHTRLIQLFCRVRRFHAVFNRVDQGLPVNWAELAADCGYFDQAHLIRDFRAFAGITPLEYSRVAPELDRRVRAAVTNAAS